MKILLVLEFPLKLAEELQLISVLRRAGHKVRVAAAVDDTESIKRLVAADAGVSIMSEVPAREDIARGQLLAFPLEGARPYHLYFLYKKRYLTAAQVAFRDFLLERAAPGDAMGEDE